MDFCSWMGMQMGIGKLKLKLAGTGQYPCDPWSNGLVLFTW